MMIPNATQCGVHRMTEKQRMPLIDWLAQLQPLALHGFQVGQRIVVPCFCDDYKACKGWGGVWPEEVEEHMSTPGRGIPSTKESIVVEEVSTDGSEEQTQQAGTDAGEAR